MKKLKLLLFILIIISIKIQSKECLVRLTNQQMSDPAPGEKKEMIVSYTLPNSPEIQKAQFSETMWVDVGLVEVRLPENAKINKAIYSSTQSEKKLDVTDHLKPYFGSSGCK